jgi:hypothetical protein
MNKIDIAAMDTTPRTIKKMDVFNLHTRRIIRQVNSEMDKPRISGMK